MEEDEKWFSAALSVKSIAITPDEIEAFFSIKPTRKHYIGDAVSNRNPRNKHKSHYYCVHSGCSSEEPMENHLENILSLFGGVSKKVKELSKTEEVVLFCGFSSGNGQGGFTLSPELLLKLSTFGVALSLDLYPPSEAFDVE